MSFNEESQMPEVPAGGEETAVKTQQDTRDVQPSVDATDRFGLQKAGKGWLLRKYNIEISKAGQPYFSPVQSLLNAFVADADAAIAESRARIKGDTDMQAEADKVVAKLDPYYNSLLEFVGQDREWLARAIALWPITDQIGYQLYKATSGEADLLDYADYLLRTDANVNDQNDLAAHEGYQKREFWTDLAYDELAKLDFILQSVEETDYNLEAIIRQGYQNAANLDTRNHLRGVAGNQPITNDGAMDDSVRANILASRRAASQAA